MIFTFLLSRRRFFSKALSPHLLKDGTNLFSKSVYSNTDFIQLWVKESTITALGTRTRMHYVYTVLWTSWRLGRAFILSFCARNKKRTRHSYALLVRMRFLDLNMKNVFIFGTNTLVIFSFADLNWICFFSFTYYHCTFCYLNHFVFDFDRLKNNSNRPSYS